MDTRPVGGRRRRLLAAPPKLSWRRASPVRQYSADPGPRRRPPRSKAGADSGRQYVFRSAGIPSPQAIRSGGFRSAVPFDHRYHPRNDKGAADSESTDPGFGYFARPSPKRGATFEHFSRRRAFTTISASRTRCPQWSDVVVVGEPGNGPGTKPFGYAPGEHWKPIPEAARKHFRQSPRFCRKERCVLADVRAAPPEDCALSPDQWIGI